MTPTEYEQKLRELSTTANNLGCYIMLGSLNLEDIVVQDSWDDDQWSEFRTRMQEVLDQ